MKEKTLSLLLGLLLQRQQRKGCSHIRDQIAETFQPKKTTKNLRGKNKRSYEFLFSSHNEVDPILLFMETTKKIEHGTRSGLRAMEVAELGELLPGRDGNSIQGDYAGWKVAFRRACHWSGRGFQQILANPVAWISALLWLW